MEPVEEPVHIEEPVHGAAVEEPAATDDRALSSELRVDDVALGKFESFGASA